MVHSSPRKVPRPLARIIKAAPEGRLQALKKGREAFFLGRDFGGTNEPRLGAKPPIFPYISTKILPQDSQV